MSFLKRIFGLTDKIEYVENIDGADANASDEVNEPVVQEEPLPENEASADEPADPEEEHERRYRFETLRDDGLRAMQSGHVEYAVQCLTAALEYQDDSETWYSLSECYTHLNQGAKALPILQRLQGETPQNAQLYTDAAIAAEQMQDWTLMAANAGKALELTPDDDNALYLLARSKFSQGDFLGAEQDLTTLLEHDAQYVTVRLLRARTYYEQGKLDDAQSDLDVLVKDESATEGAWLLQGMMCEQKGEWEAAVSAYQRMLELDPFNTEAPLRIARIYMDQNRPTEALAVLDEAISMREDFIPAYKLRAEVKRSIGDAAGADDDEAKASQLVPEDMRGEENLEERMNNFYKSINPYGF